MFRRYAIAAGLFTCLATAGIVLAQPANRERAFGEAPRTFETTDANEAAAEENQEAAEAAAEAAEAVEDANEAQAEQNLDQRVEQLAHRVAALERRWSEPRRDFEAMLRARGRFSEEEVKASDFSIFTLKNSSSNEMARLLMELFGQNRGQSIRLAADARTNSVIVGADAETMKSIAAIIQRLDEMKSAE